jgi:hypothetical protein
MSAVGGGNYISDGQIMAWLARQQDRIYDDLRGCIDLSQDRADACEQLNNIKAQLQSANKSHDFSQVDRDLQAFMAQHQNDPEYATICDDLAKFAEQIHAGYVPHENYAKDMAAYEQAVDTANAQVAPSDLMSLGASFGASIELKKPEEPPPQVYDKEQIKTWEELIGGKVDRLGKNDQLAMIHIQELKATLDQGSQLASTFISSGDKTTSAIINNIA